MKHPSCRALLEYWEERRGSRRIPDQGDIEPRALKALLPYVLILDAADASEPVYRLAGTALCEQFGAELKGVGFLSSWEPASRRTIAAMLRQSQRQLRPIWLYAVGMSSNCGTVELETVLVPIAFQNVEGVRFLGVTRAMGHLMSLGGRPILSQRLIASKVIEAAQKDKGPARTSAAPSPLRLAFSRVADRLRQPAEILPR